MLCCYLLTALGISCAKKQQKIVSTFWRRLEEASLQVSTREKPSSQIIDHMTTGVSHRHPAFISIHGHEIRTFDHDAHVG